MNRGVLRPDMDLRLGGSDVLWSTMGGVEVQPLNAGPVIGAAVSWPATANTLTSWTEITSASPFACCAIDVFILGHVQSGQHTGMLVDIGTGSGGSETVLIDGIPSFGRSRFLCVRFPIRVAASTRFAFRVQAATAAGSLTTPQSPTVGLGFIRDIPEFPAGTSVSGIGSIDRATSQWANLSNLNGATARRSWVNLGDVPAGKMIYAVPFQLPAANSLNSVYHLADFGWHSSTGTAFDTPVGEPQEVFADSVLGMCDVVEQYNSNTPTVWIPDGYIGGSVRVATDASPLISQRSIVCFAVME